jgi:hypothetical protein
MDIYLATKNAAEAECRMKAILPDYSKSGKELKSKIIKEYEEAINRLNELIKHKF